MHPNVEQYLPFLRSVLCHHVTKTHSSGYGNTFAESKAQNTQRGIKKDQMAREIICFAMHSHFLLLACNQIRAAAFFRP